MKKTLTKQHLTARVNPEAIASIKKIAEQEQRSFSQVLEFAMQQYAKDKLKAKK